MTNISVSKAKTFDTCKLQYKYKYVSRFKREIPKQVDVTTKGLVMHQCFEDLVKYENYENGVAGTCKRKADEAIVLKVFRDAVNQYHLSTEAAVNYRLGLGLKRWLSFKEYLDKRGHILYAEKEYEKVIYGNTTTKCILDLLEDLGDGKFVIYDYKTPNKANASNHSKQLAVYAYMMAIEKGFIEPGSTDYKTVADHFDCYIFFPLCEGDHEDYSKSLKQLNLSEEVIRKAMEWLQTVDDTASSFDFNQPAVMMFPSTTNNLCDWCDFQGAGPQPEIGFEGCPLTCFAGHNAGTKYIKQN